MMVRWVLRFMGVQTVQVLQHGPWQRTAIGLLSLSVFLHREASSAPTPASLLDLAVTVQAGYTLGHMESHWQDFWSLFDEIPLAQKSQRENGIGSGPPPSVQSQHLHRCSHKDYHH